MSNTPIKPSAEIAPVRIKPQIDSHMKHLHEHAATLAALADATSVDPKPTHQDLWSAIMDIPNISMLLTKSSTNAINTQAGQELSSVQEMQTNAQILQDQQADYAKLNQENPINKPKHHRKGGHGFWAVVIGVSIAAAVVCSGGALAIAGAVAGAALSAGAAAACVAVGCAAGAGIGYGTASGLSRSTTTGKNLDAPSSMTDSLQPLINQEILQSIGVKTSALQNQAGICNTNMQVSAQRQSNAAQQVSVLSNQAAQAIAMLSNMMNAKA